MRASSGRGSHIPTAVSLPIAPGPTAGHWEASHDLLIRPDTLRPSARFAVTYFDETGSARRVFDGPELPGPYAFVSRRHVNPTGEDEERPTHRVRPGDEIRLGVNRFRLVTSDGSEPELELIDAPAIPSPRTADASTNTEQHPTPTESSNHMANEPILTVSGNLGSDPELRFTAGGDAVVNFSVAQTPSTYDAKTGEWADGKTIWMSCVAWRGKAEAIAEAFHKGSRVIAHGRLKTSEWTTKDGENRSKLELEIIEAGLAVMAPSADRRPQESRQAQGRPAQADSNPWNTAPAAGTSEPQF